MGQSQGRRHYNRLQRHGSRGEEGLRGEGEEGEEVHLCANREAAWEAKGVCEQEEQAVHWQAKGPTEGQHKGLRPPLGQRTSFTQRLEKTCPNTEIQLDCSTEK